MAGRNSIKPFTVPFRSPVYASGDALWQAAIHLSLSLYLVDLLYTHHEMTYGRPQLFKPFTVPFRSPVYASGDDLWQAAIQLSLSLYFVDLLYTHQEMPYGRPQFI